MDSRHSQLTMCAHGDHAALLAALWRWTAGSRRELCAHTRVLTVVLTAPENAGQLLDAKIEETMTWDEVYDVFFANSCMNVLVGRSFMRVSAWSTSVMSTIITCVYS